MTLVCKQMTTLSPLLSVLCKASIEYSSFSSEFAANLQVNFKLGHRIKLWNFVGIIIDEIFFSAHELLQSNAFLEVPIYHPSLWRREIDDIIAVFTLEN